MQNLQDILWDVHQKKEQDHLNGFKSISFDNNNNINRKDYC